jgi:hypothetical protein
MVLSMPFLGNQTFHLSGVLHIDISDDKHIALKKNLGFPAFPEVVL